MKSAVNLMFLGAVLYVSGFFLCLYWGLDPLKTFFAMVLFGAASKFESAGTARARS